MDPWNRNVETPFDNFFDLNGDGMLDPIEQAYKIDFLTKQIEEDERAVKFENDFNRDDLEFMNEDDFDRDDLEFMNEDDLDRDGLEFMNEDDLDLDDLEFMDEAERREALEEVGYDPNDSDDDF